MDKDNRPERDRFYLKKGRTKTDAAHRQKRSNKHTTTDLRRSTVLTMALNLFYKNFMDFASKAYKKALGSELKKMGEWREVN